MAALHSAVRWLGRGVRNDVQARLQSGYLADWRVQNGKLRVLAASTYIFCASVVPAIAFGEQFYSGTSGILSAVHVLLATAITGITQALLGGQPLLIVGVAEPIVLIYKYIYDFAKDKDDIGPELYLAWCAWVCVWASIMVILLALTNACTYISHFTRFAGELFGALISMLFLQQAIKGIVEEFRFEEEAGVMDPAASQGGATWQLVNGLWAIFLALGLLFTSVLVRTARSWRFLRAPVRGFLADYGTFLMLVAFTGLSFAVQGEGVPQRVRSPNAWNAGSNWTVVSDMGRLKGEWIAAAIIPAILVAILFYFDHNVSAQLAQQPEFGLRKPSAYHYDMMLLGFMTLVCGLLGIPPVNGVLPQSPMHTKSLARVLGKDKVRVQAQQTQQDEAVESDEDEQQGTVPATQTQAGRIRRISAGASLAGQKVHPSGSAQSLLPGTTSGILLPPATAPGPPPLSVAAHLPASAAAANGDSKRLPSLDAVVPVGPTTGASALPGLIAAEGPAGAGDGKLVEGGEGDTVVVVQVLEQRWSNLLQAIAVGACVGAMPVIRLIPTAALWGYFAYMALEGLDSQLWDRTLLLLTDPSRRAMLLEQGHAPYLETVPFRIIVVFTAFQLAYLLAVYGLTWAGIAGILFPVPIMLLVPLRQYVMPRLFRNRRHLQELDATWEEEAAPLPHDQAVQEALAHGLASAASGRGIGGPPREEGASPVPGLGSYEEAGELDEGEVQHLRVVHHLSRESLIRRRQQSAEAERSEAEVPSPMAGTRPRRPSSPSGPDSQV